MFTHLVNVQLSDSERAFFQTGILSPLAYKSKPGKVRPVIILDTLLKVSWLVALQDIHDPNITKSSHTFGCRGSAQLSLFTVQQALDSEEGIVIALDACNAYNTIFRNKAMDYLEKHRVRYSKSFPLVNLMYTEQTSVRWYSQTEKFASINITHGTRQGCVSGLWFYTLATLETNLLYRNFITQTADDVYIVRYPRKSKITCYLGLLGVL